MARFVDEKSTFTEDRELDTVAQTVKLSWWEPASMDEWGGAGPMITLEFDPENQFLLFVTIAYNRRLAASGRALTADQLRASMFKQLDSAGVFTDGADDGAAVGIVAM